MTDTKSSQPSTKSLGKRRYIRIPSVIPVDYQLISKSLGPLGSEIRTGVTRDMSENGLCLGISALPSEIGMRLESNDLSDLQLLMDIGVARRTLRIVGRVAWSTTVLSGNRRSYRVGVEFIKISKMDSDAIVHFAKWAERRPKLVRAAVAGLATVSVIVLGLLWWNSHAHQQELNAAQQRVANANDRYRGAAEDLEALTADLLALSKEVRAWQQEQLRESSMRGSPQDRGNESGIYEPEIIASAVQELRSDIERLKGQIAILRMAGEIKEAPTEGSEPTESASAAHAGESLQGQEAPGQTE